MITEFKVKVLWKPLELGEEDIYAGESVRIVTREDFSSYESQNIEIVVAEDGAIYFSSDNAESFIYFYPDQLKHLHRAVGVALKQSRRSLHKTAV